MPLPLENEICQACTESIVATERVKHMLTERELFVRAFVAGMNYDFHIPEPMRSNIALEKSHKSLNTLESEFANKFYDFLKGIKQ